MSSYIYMKILESQPERYDRGVALLSLGQAGKVKHRLVEENVRPGFNVLEIGCGTGTMAMLAARKGAHVLAFDVSPHMLHIARAKVETAGLDESIELREMGVSGMDKFDDQRFDLVMSTLVFSELSSDEQRYALRHAYRILKSGGRIAIADEARPRRTSRRILHSALRIPLLIVTFALTQTTTKAVKGLEARVLEAGFRMEATMRSSLDSFLYLIGVKEKGE
jgi:demethylmenaquinone methyltransferase/2-methoxy-6-polyprenyl-1,4-benzoquinol methylase